MNEVVATMDAYASAFLTKCVHIVLTSRVPRLSVFRNAESDRWFNFGVGEVEEAKEKLREWDESPRTPFFVQIFYRDVLEGSQERMVEVWRMAYLRRSGEGNDRDVERDPMAIYRHMVLLCRALYTYLRLLPSHPLFRAASDDAEGQRYVGRFELSTEEGAVDMDVEDMRQWQDAISLEMPDGRLIVQVSIRDVDPFLQTLSKEQALSVSKEFDQEYVHFAPKAADTTQSRFQNPVTEHFVASLENVKTAVASLVSRSSFKKMLSFNRSTDHPQEASSEEAHVFEFLKAIRRRNELTTTADETVSIEEGRKALGIYLREMRHRASPEQATSSEGCPPLHKER